MLSLFTQAHSRGVILVSKLSSYIADSGDAGWAPPQQFVCWHTSLRLQAKAEHDAYLAQVEAEGQAEAIYGKGVQLIVPEPGVVIKTKDSANDTRIYINVCTSSKVELCRLVQADSTYVVVLRSCSRFSLV